MWSREGVGVAPFRLTTGAFLLVKHSEDLMRWLDAITTARRRLSREDLVVVCLMLLAIAAQLHASLTVPSPLQQRDIFRDDVANYASVLVQTDSPDVFDGDLIYGDDGRVRLARANARVYMAVLERLHDASGDNFYRASQLYTVVVFATYLPGMYLLLATLIPSRFFALGLAFVSTKVSGFFATGTTWGVPLEAVLPHHLGFAISPWCIWLLYRLVLRPGARGRHIGDTRVILLGVLYGLLTSFVHSVSCLALAEWTIGIIGIQALRGRLARRVPALFVVGFLVAASTYFFSPEWVSPVNAQLTGAKVTPVLADNGMVFPWLNNLVPTDRYLAPLAERYGLASLVEHGTAVAVAGHLLGTVALGGLIWWRPRALWSYAFVVLQTGFITAVMDVSLLPLGLLAYAIARIRRGEVDELDRGLTVAIVIAVLIGPTQQALLYILWSWFQPVALASLLFESVRFMQFAYFPFYVLLGRSIWYVVGPTKSSVLTFLGGSFLLYVSSLALGLPLGALRDQPDVVLFALMTWVGIALWRLWVDVRRAVLASALVASAVAGLCVAGVLTFWGISGWSLVMLTSYGVGGVVLAAGQVVTRRGVVATLGLGFAGVLLGIVLLPNQLVTTTSGLTVRLADARRMSRSARIAVEPNAFTLDATEGYEEVTQWARLQSPQGSVFHLAQPQPSFRYYARRPILVSPREWTYGLQAGHDPTTLLEMIGRLYPSPFDADQVLSQAGELGADYIVSEKSDPFPSVVETDGRTYTTNVAFENGTYTIYRVGFGTP